LRERIVASRDDDDRVDQELLRRAEMAAVVAALGVACADLAQSDTKGIL
jgi:hypothetical protein